MRADALVLAAQSSTGGFGSVGAKVIVLIVVVGFSVSFVAMWRRR